MLDLALMGSAFLMGLAGSIHCVSMCAAPCAAVTGGAGRPAAAFHAGRLLSYGLGGAVAASSIGLLWQWEQAAAWLRPLWLSLHLAVLALGLWLLWRGEQPLWMQRRWGTPELLRGGATPAREGRTSATPNTAAPHAASGLGRADAAGLASLVRRGRPVAAGLAWVAWPCGLLQSALLVASLATHPVAGAMVMGAFAIGSSPGLWAAPWLLRRLAGRSTAAAKPVVIAWHARVTQPAGGFSAGAASTSLRPDTVATAGADGLRWATRLSGLLLSAAALWALGHGLWLQIRAYCG